MTERIGKRGISLKVVNIVLIAVALVLCALMIYSTFHLAAGTRTLTDTTEQQIELRKAAREMMDASDYLTEKVQRFTIRGNIRFLNEYFDEVFLYNHREDSITRMSQGKGSEEALARLQSAMDESVSLMEVEYYAMKLVIAANGYTDYPDVLRSVKLSDEDLALSPSEMMHRATVMVMDDSYYSRKDLIRENLNASLDELEKLAYDRNTESMSALKHELGVVRIIIVLLIFGIVLLVFLTSHLGINPVLNAVDRIKNDSHIPESGAKEFRYLARAYNKMYDAYRSSLEHLNYKASHDELTGAYNRAGYDLLLSGIDLRKTYMLLFDIDNFKSINDTYGHETGDMVLKKLVDVLRVNFRSDDYICRIGGDEFVVFMSHTAKVNESLISRKIREINRMMENDDELPPASISVGITHGEDASDAKELFERADSALYTAKNKGKHTYSFYTGA